MAIKFEVFKQGALINKEILSLGVIKIGRLASNHLPLDAQGVSKMHAIIETDEKGMVDIIDLASAEGTFVNGKKVNRCRLGNGDTLKLGDIELRITFVEVQQETTAPIVTAPPVPETALGTNSPAISNTAPQLESVSPVPQAPPATALTPTFGATPAFIDLNAIEDVNKQAIEVVVMWNGSVLQVNHYQEDAKKVENFYIGEAPECDFPIPVESLRGQTKVPLVVNKLGGGASVTLLPEACGDVTFEDGTRSSLSDIVSTGQAVPSPEFQGGYTFAVPQKGRIKMDFENWSFLVNSVPNPKKFVAPFQMDWTTQVYTGFSLLVHAVFLFLIYFVPPNPGGISLDNLDGDDKYIAYLLSPPEVTQEVLPEFLKKETPEKEQGGKGKRHKGNDGAMGDERSRKTDNRYAVKGPKDTKNPHMARDMAKEMAKNAGILSYLSSAQAPTSPFGQATALGTDPENALGALMGNQPGSNFGYHGLGLQGTGRGGGGTGEGTIGLGSLATIGHGGGGGTNQGYGRGAGGLRGRPGGKGPRIGGGTAVVKGSLSKEVIRRIVRRHLNEVKFCYERQLAKRPDLSGRVSVRFIIAGNGSVQGAAVAESTLGDPSTENCIASAVRRWAFPQPDGGGIVIVTYPFLLTAPQD